MQFGAESLISAKRLTEFMELPEIGDDQNEGTSTSAAAGANGSTDNIPMTPQPPARRPSKAAIPVSARSASMQSLGSPVSPQSPNGSQYLGLPGQQQQQGPDVTKPVVEVINGTFAWDVAVSQGGATGKPAAGDGANKQRNDGPMPVQARQMNFSIVPARRRGNRANTGLVLDDPSPIPAEPPSGNGAAAGTAKPADLSKTAKGSTTSLIHVPKLRTILHDMTLQLKPGQLTAIVGPVGAGKSSTILAILGEMISQGGAVKMNTEHVAYCPQAPWIVSGTVRDNIVFGGEYDEDKFNQVVADCALTRDLELLPKGAESLIGERGVTLSGGQKARLSLARAVYHDADLFLLDDPLSAVDASVGRHLFEKTILGRLTRERKKAVLLVTHQLQFVKHADQILVLEDGKINVRGTWSEIVGDPSDKTNIGTPFIEVLKEFEKNADSGMDVDIDDLAMPGNEDSMPEKIVDEDDDESSDEEIPLADEEEEELGKSEGTMRVERLAAPRQVVRRLSLAPHPSNLPEDPMNLPDVRPSKSEKEKALVPADTAATANGSKESKPAAKDAKDDSHKEFVSEDRAVGSVKGGIYLEYFRRGGGRFAIVFLLIFMSIGEALRVSCDWWLSHWTSLSPQDQRDPRNMGIYGALVASLMTVALTRSFGFYWMTIGSSAQLSKDALHCVLGAPLWWMQVNPHGRVLNRFSKDLNQVDEMLPLTLFDFLQWCVFAPRCSGNLIFHV